MVRFGGSWSCFGLCFHSLSFQASSKASHSFTLLCLRFAAKIYIFPSNSHSFHFLSLKLRKIKLQNFFSFLSFTSVSWEKTKWNCLALLNEVSRFSVKRKGKIIFIGKKMIQILFAFIYFL